MYVDRVALMAAAVPVGFVQRGGSLASAAAADKQTLILCSEGDAVLHLAFPLGETAGGDGFFPSAVGRDGDPAWAWTSPPVPMATGVPSPRKYGHGDYWTGVESANQVSAMLGRAPSRSTPTSGLLTRGLPSANAIESANIPPYRTPTRPGLL